MERFTRGLTFWVLLVASLVPTIAYGQQLKKTQKCLYSANVASNGYTTGSASLVMQTKVFLWPDDTTTSTVDLTYRAKSLINGVEKVHLAYDSSAVPLCDPGGEPCDYDDFLNLFIAGSLTTLPPLFPPNLLAGNVQVQFNDGALGSGNLLLAQPCSTRILIP